MRSIFIVVSCLVFLVYRSFPHLKTFYDGEKEFFAYQNSRYVQGDKSSDIISDSRLYALKGYLFIDKNLPLTNFEPGHPPLASYFMGISNALFGHPLWANIIAGSVFFLTFYWFLCQVSNQRLATLAFFTLIIQGLINQQFVETYLDIYQLLFALIGIASFQYWWRSDRDIFLFICQISLGLMLSTKFFLSGIVLPISLTLGVLAGNSLKKFLKFVFSMFFIFVGFGIGHLSFFIHNGSIVDFIRFQRYVLNWWAGSPIVPPFQMWDLVFFNRWHTWWGSGILSVPEWSPLWAIFLVGGLVSPIFIKFNKSINPLFLSSWLWLVLGLIQLSFTAIFPRHLLFVFLPSLILISLTLQNHIRRL